jgi:hypothetical protein
MPFLYSTIDSFKAEQLYLVIEGGFNHFLFYDYQVISSVSGQIFVGNRCCKDTGL